MAYEIQLPNGVVVEVPDSITPEQAQKNLVKQFPDLFPGRGKKQGFFPAASAGMDSAQAAMYGFGAELADRVGLDGLATGLRANEEKNRKEAQKNYIPTEDFDVDNAWKKGVFSGIGALANKHVKEPLGGMAGAIVPSAIGAGIGALTPVPGGAAAGFMIPMTAQSSGENIERQRQEGQDVDLTKATAIGIIQGALNTYGGGKMLNGIFGSGLALREAEKLAPKVLTGQLTKEAAAQQLGSRLRNVGIETAGSAGLNTGLGVVDEGLRRAQAGQSLTDEGAIDAYKDIAKTAAVAAPIFGGIHGMGQRGRAEALLRNEELRGNMQRQQIQREQQQDALTEQQADRGLNDLPPEVVQPEVPRLPPPEVKSPEQAKTVLEQQLQPEPPRLPPPEQTQQQAPPQTPEIKPQPPEVVQPEVKPEVVAPQPPITPEPPAPPVKPVTRKEDFADMVFPRSKTFRELLDGHDLSTPEGVDGLYGVLRRYRSNIEESPKNTDRVARLDAKIAELEAMREEIKHRPPETKDVQTTDVTNDVPDVRVGDQPIPPTDSTVKEATHVKPPPPPDHNSRPAEQNLGQRNQQQTVSSGLPPDVGRRDGVTDGPATTDVSGKSRVNDTLIDNPDRQLPPLDDGRWKEAETSLRNTPELQRTPEETYVEFGSRLGARQAKNGMLSGHHNPELGKAILAKDSQGYGDMAGAARTLEGSKNVMVSHIGQQAKKLLGDVKIMRDDGTVLKANFPDMRDVGGMYHPGYRSVVMHDKHINNEHVVAHELAHALTVKAIEKPTPQQKPFVRRLDKLYQHVKQVHEMKGQKAYGITNLKEFVAEAYSNPHFQFALTHIKYANTTAWGKFTDLVARILGIKADNAFTEFLANAEGLEKASKRPATKWTEPSAGKADAGPAPEPSALGDYADSTTPEMPRGGAGRMFDAAKNRGTLKDLKDKVIQGAFDDKHGVTRFLENAWTRVNTSMAAGREATARALLQASTYASQLARESLGTGFVKLNGEGFWKLQQSQHNLGSFIEAVKGLPTNEDKFRVANGILTNLSYHEREMMLADKQAGAAQLLAEARREFKEAKAKTGREAARLVRSATAKKRMYDDLMDTQYKRPKGVTDQTILQALADAQTPEVKKMLEAVREINRQNIDMLKEGGIIDQETASLWKTKEHYVPLQRIMEDDPIGSNVLLAQGGSRTRDIKGFGGSERDVGDITENLIRQRMYVVDAAMRNRAYTKALEELQADPSNPAGVHALGDKKPPGMRDVVEVKIDGEKQYFQVQDRLALETFRGIVQDAPGLADAMENFTKFFREAIMRSPDAIFRGLVRDGTEIWNFGASDKSFAGVQGRIWSQFLKNVPEAAREGFTGTMHKPHFDVNSFGITGAKEFTSLDAERAQIIREQIKRTGAKDWGATADGIIDKMMRLSMLKSLGAVAEQGEVIPRNHVFKEVLARTGSETEAAMAAINTLDFRRRGNWNTITIAKKLIPFFNSQLQGWYKIGSALAGDNLSSGYKNPAEARRALYMKAAKMAAAAAAYQFAMQDDPDYMEIKKEIRDTNMLVHVGFDEGTGKKLFMKFPIPFEFGSMFWTIPANVAAYASDKQDTGESMKALKDAFVRAMPGLIPQAVKPVVENWTNYSFFGGRNLENAGIQRVEESKRAYDSTSDVAKGIGEVTGYSPIKADNLLRGYFGSLGGFAVAAVDKMLLEDGTDPDKAWHRGPVAKSLIVDPMSSASRDKFYELKEKIEKVRNTANAMKMKPEEARAYLAGETDGVPNKVLYDMYSGVQQLNREMARALQAEKQIKASDDSPEQKRVRLEHIRKLLNGRMQQAMPTLKQHLAEADEEDDTEEVDE